MKDLRSFAWYAARISPHLPDDAFKPVPTRLYGGLAYLLVSVSGILAIALFNLEWWQNILISLIIGLSFAGKCFLGHEILHGTVVRNAKLRNLLGAAAFWSLSIGPQLWRKWHNLNHHIHTQHVEKDPDTWKTVEFVSKRPILAKIFKTPRIFRTFGYVVFLMINFTFHSTRMFFQYIKDFKSSKRPSVWFELLLPWMTWVSLLLLIGPIKWIFAYLIPLLIANFIMSSYVATNHNLNPQTEVNDPLANSLTVTVPKWVDVLHFNFSHHAEHHLFPGMNPKFYPLVKEKIKEMWPERYHEMPMTTAMLALLKTPRIYHEKHELVDIYGGKAYDSLGMGLDPKNIQSREVNLTDKFV